MSDGTADETLVDAEDGTDSVRPIRALQRGLEALRALNGRTSATVTDIARAIRLPRTTAYRVLETLCAAGYAIRDPADDRYRLTLQVRSLADGVEDDPWITAAARPVLAKATKEHAWPLAIATLYGTSMLVRDAGEGVAGRDSVGRAPLLESSAGRVLLAFCGDEQLSTLLDILTRSDRPQDKLARDKDQLNRLLAETRNNAWALYDDGATAELELAIPILARNRPLAVLVMRFTRDAISLDQAIEKYVPLLRRVAEDIARAFEALGSTPPT